MNINEHNIEIINKVMSIDGTESEINGSVTNIKANLTTAECETIFTTFKTKEDVQLALRLLLECKIHQLLQNVTKIYSTLKFFKNMPLIIM